MLHNVDEYINCVHNIVCGYFLDPKVDSILYELVKTYKSIGIQKLVGDTKILTEKYNIFKTVSDYINKYLNPSKHNF